MKYDQNIVDDFYNINFIISQIEFCSDTERLLNIYEMRNKARLLKIPLKDFDKMVSAADAAIKENIKILKNAECKVDNNEKFTIFTGQPLVLNCDNFTCDDTGVTDFNDSNIILHPIMITKTLVNIETGYYKVEISFKKDGNWKSIIVDKSIIANSRNIVEPLSRQGIAIDSNNASRLVDYFTKQHQLNENVIPKVQSISRLGWVGNEFSPYLSEIQFDGEHENNKVFLSVASKGDYELWKNAIVNKCNESESFRIMFAASIASPMLSILDTLPFIVHLWGVSGCGKTLALQSALSFWGNPLGLIGNHNGTLSHCEAFACFLNSLPFGVDESQMGNRKNIEKDFIYMLTQGQGRGRANKDSTAKVSKTWKNITISTGECPLTEEYTGAGAINRVLSIESNDKIFPDNTGNAFADIVQNNYGFLGKNWTSYLSKNSYKIKEKYKEIVKELSGLNTTDKQVLSISVIQCALTVFNEFSGFDISESVAFFKKESLVEAEGVSIGQRAYGYIVDKVNMNMDRFNKKSGLEQWGIIDEMTGFVEFYTAAFNDLLRNSDLNFSPSQVKSWMITNDLAICKLKKIENKVSRTIKIKTGLSPTTESF